MADYYWKSIQARCPDGKLRKVKARHHCYDGSLAPDTFFSVPAAIWICSKNITGFLDCNDSREYTFHPHSGLGYVFKGR